MATTYTFYELWAGRPVDVQAGQPRRFTDMWTCVVDYGEDGDDITNPVSRMQVGQEFADQANTYIGTPHRDWPAARCTRIYPVCDEESPSQWTITVEFSEPAVPPGVQVGGDPAGGHDVENPEPTLRAPKVEVDFRLEPYYDQKDKTTPTAKVYKNTVGDLLENVPPKFKTIIIIKWERCYAEWSEDLGVALVNKCNDANWRGYATGEARISGCTASLTNDGGNIFWVVNFSVEIDTLDGWVPTLVLNIGRNALVGGNKVVATDKFDKPYSNPVMLDVAGAVTSTPYYLSFTNYESISFDALDA